MSRCSIRSGVVKGCGGSAFAPAVGSVLRRFLLWSLALYPFAAAGTAEVNPAIQNAVRLLHGRSEPLRLLAIRSLSADAVARQAASSEIIEAARRQVAETHERDVIPVPTFELIRLLGKIDDDDSELCLIELLDCPRTEIAMTVADVLGEHQRFGAIEALKQQTARKEFEEQYGYRFNLIRALLRMRHPDAVEFLGSLEAALDGQLRHELGIRLDEVTVEQFQGDEARFEQWKRETGRGEGTTGIILASDAGSGEPIRLAHSHYYGIPIHAKRLAFVIDCSDSMNKPTYRGTRLLEAKRELASVVRSLPDDAEFTIITYNELLVPWREELVAASPENKAKALQYIQGLRSSKKTATYDAMRKALEIDDNLESVFLISDGRPNTGSIIAPGLIVDDLSLRNRFRNVVIHTVGISVSGPTQTFMASLAERNAGTFRAFD